MPWSPPRIIVGGGVSQNAPATGVPVTPISGTLSSNVQGMLEELVGALGSDMNFVATVAASIATKVGLDKTLLIYEAKSLPLPSRSSFVPAGYTGAVGVFTVAVPTITDSEILAFLTNDSDFVIELAP